MIALLTILAYLAANLLVCFSIEYYDVTRNVVRYGDEKNMSGPAYYLHKAGKIYTLSIIVLALLGIPILIIEKAHDLLEKMP